MRISSAKSVIFFGVACGAVVIERPDEVPGVIQDEAWKVRLADDGTPVYPESYTISGTFSLPYASIVTPYVLSVDNKKGREYLGWYDGLDSFLYDYEDGVIYENFIWYDRPRCLFSKSAPGTQPQQPSPPLVFFPNITQANGFDYKGTEDCPGQRQFACHWWQKKDPEAKRVTTFTFWAVDDGAYTPWQYTMMGYDVVFASHYDQYVIRYTAFSGYPVDDLLELPGHCKEFVNDGHLEATGALPVSAASEDRQAHHFNIFSLVQDFMQGVDHSYRRFKEHVANFGDKLALPDGERQNFSGNHEELHHRLPHFVKNMHRVNHMNLNSKGETTYGVNHFALLSKDEWHPFLMGYRRLDDDTRPKPLTKVEVYDPVHRPSAPQTKDWRLEGAVGHVRDQGICGSCWAFSASETLQAQWFLQTGEQDDLSSQQLMDCSWDYGNMACDGGEGPAALQYVIDNGGLQYTNDYEYEMVDDYCRYNPAKGAATAAGIVRIDEGDEAALESAAGTVGPISVAYDAGHDSMVFYSSGIYYEPECSSTDLDHAVMVVGYGIDKEAPEGKQEYWIVKNSWSEYWGSQGYFWLAKNRDNHCGIATDAGYPTIKTNPA
eukprot:Clim_evm8s14 gene=Clim_evmTU8s14